MTLIGDTLTLICTLWLFLLWVSHRTIFLKPSISLIALTMMTLVWPHMLMRETIREYTAFADDAYLYTVIFAIGGLMVTNGLEYLNNTAHSNPLSSLDDLNNKNDLKMAKSIHKYGLVLIIAIMALYLFYVPPTQTGLYAILFDPENSGIARENSLKLLDFKLLKYVYLIAYSLVAPLVFLIGLNIYYYSKPANWPILITEGVLVSLFLMLTGARAGLAYLAVAWLALVIIRRKMKLKTLEVGLAVGFFLVFPAVLSQVREGGGDADLSTYVGYILDRIFLIPTIISAWFLEYANTYGYGGWMGLFGQGELGSLYNSIALEYMERYEPIRDSGVTAPSAYFIQNLYLFGWYGLIPSWAGLFYMDWPAQHIKELPGPLVAPFYAIAVFYTLFFLQSGYGIVWITNGYLIFAVLIILLSKKARWYGKNL